MFVFGIKIVLCICLNSYACSENANIEQYYSINRTNPGQDNLFLRNRYFCI